MEAEGLTNTYFQNFYDQNSSEKIYNFTQLISFDFQLFRIADWRETKKWEAEAAQIKKNPDQYRSKQDFFINIIFNECPSFHKCVSLNH